MENTPKLKSMAIAACDHPGIFPKSYAKTSDADAGSGQAARSERYYKWDFPFSCSRQPDVCRDDQLS
jgi:hypothetical protein